MTNKLTDADKAALTALAREARKCHSKGRAEGLQTALIAIAVLVVKNQPGFWAELARFENGDFAAFGLEPFPEQEPYRGKDAMHLDGKPPESSQE
jgi:hypothetical protein